MIIFLFSPYLSLLLRFPMCCHKAACGSIFASVAAAFFVSSSAKSPCFFLLSPLHFAPSSLVLCSLPLCTMLPPPLYYAPSPFILCLLPLCPMLPSPLYYVPSSLVLAASSLSFSSQLRQKDGKRTAKGRQKDGNKCPLLPDFALMICRLCPTWTLHIPIKPGISGVIQ